MDSQQAKIFSAILLASTILGIVLLYFIITIVQSQRKHLRLQQAKLAIEASTLENERKRIVSDLHDELGPLLSVVKFQVSSVATVSDNDHYLIEKANQNLDIILDRVRGICNQLMPQVLLRKGLIDAIREYVYELDCRSNMNCSFTYEPALRLNSNLEIHLYRIVQEILNNAIKHSGAENLVVDMRMNKHHLVITIRDDGKGFDVNLQQHQSSGFGLRNIWSRVKILKGEMFLHSSPGNGATYTIEIPIQHVGG